MSVSIGTGQASLRKRGSSLRPSAIASGMPCTLPLGERLRRVHVGVGVEPDHAARAAVRGREPAERADGDRVVAAEDERQLAGATTRTTSRASCSQVALIESQ